MSKKIKAYCSTLSKALNANSKQNKKIQTEQLPSLFLEYSNFSRNNKLQFFYFLNFWLLSFCSSYPLAALCNIMSILKQLKKAGMESRI